MGKHRKNKKAKAIKRKHRRERVEKEYQIELINERNRILESQKRQKEFEIEQAESKLKELKLKGKLELYSPLEKPINSINILSGAVNFNSMYEDIYLLEEMNYRKELKEKSKN